MKLEGSLPCRVAGTFGFPSLDLSCLSLSGGGGCRCSTSKSGLDVLLLLLLLLLPGREKETAERRGHPGQGAPEELPPWSLPAAGLPRAGALAAPLGQAGWAGLGGDQYNWKVRQRQQRWLRSVPVGIWGGCARLGEGRGAGVRRPWGKGGRRRGLGAAEPGPAGGEGWVLNHSSPPKLAVGRAETRGLGLLCVGVEVDFGDSA